MAQDFYDVLGINKSATADDIKKAYRKQAMKYHPDRNKGNPEAEKKFKEINEAYGVLSDTSKKKNYDMFGSEKANPFRGGSQSYSTSNGGFSGFEDLFGGFGGASSTRGGASFDFSDLFGHAGGRQTSTNGYSQQRESLDIEATYEVPIFDLILGCKIEVQGQNKKKVKLKIPANTKPGAKLRVKGMGKSMGGKTGNLIVKIEARMPKTISEVDKSMLEKIRENIGY